MAKTKQTTFSKITASTRKLLNKGESITVDYKRDLNGLKSEDLVAFANSEDGGTILIGIDELSESKTQQGIIHGCDTSDKSKMIIMSKAADCIPPISISIIIENTAEQSFFRVDIPSGVQKPHCTKGGVYKIRRDGRNSTLMPDELLDIYLAKEAKKFKTHFEKATKNIVKNINSISDEISFMNSMINLKVENIVSSLGWTEMEASDSKSSINNIESYVRNLLNEQRDINLRVKSVIDHYKLEDPVRIQYMNQVAMNLVSQYEANEKIFQKALKGQISFDDDSKWKLTDDEKKSIIKKSSNYLWNKRNPDKPFSENSTI